MKGDWFNQLAWQRRPWDHACPQTARASHATNDCDTWRCASGDRRSVSWGV